MNQLLRPMKVEIGLGDGVAQDEDGGSRLRKSQVGRSDKAVRCRVVQCSAVDELGDLDNGREISF